MPTRLRRCARVAAFALVALVASLAFAAGNEKPATFGAPRQEFTPPAPGTYVLQRIQRAPQGFVVDSDGRSAPLARYTSGAITLLSFVYTYCTDPLGCPFAYETFVEVKRRVRAEPMLRERVRLVSVSFDPTHDTPEKLRLYGGAHAKETAPAWHFVTTGSVHHLMPILDAFGQDVAVELDAQRHATRTLNHTLKVFLLDRDGTVREIYTTAFLLPDVIVNDMKTLALEERGAHVASPQNQ